MVWPSHCISRGSPLNRIRIRNPSYKQSIVLWQIRLFGIRVVHSSGFERGLRIAAVTSTRFGLALLARCIDAQTIPRHTAATER